MRHTVVTSSHAPAAHPQMREVAIPLLHQMRSQVPVIFDDIEEAAHETV